MVVQKKMDKPLTLGVDIGGTKVNVALVDAAGRLLSVHKSLIHPEKEPKMVIADILAGVEVCLSKTGQEAKALGIGIAAQVDLKGVVHGSPNLGWRNFPLKKKLEKQLGLPVVVTNDVRAATWGEWCYGSGRGVDDLAVLFVGTGVGGGVISGGKVLSGCTNSGGELGHITIVSDGRKCRCPNKGCLEAYAGGWAIAERAQEAIRTLSYEGRRLLSLAGSIKQVTAVTVSQAYREGDLLARLLVEETGQYLAAGVVSIVNAFNPCLLVLGGGVIEGIPELIQMVKDITRNRALEAAVEELEIVKAALGGDAGVIGAAALAQDLVDKAP
ncbi:MAG: ROK family protein [Candidatus Bathyarchaeota archaeon]|nr:ROK family protein [Candidatus Bathyarchaeota archaeon]